MIGEFLRRKYWDARFRLSPLHGVVRARDHRRVRRAPQFSAGEAPVKGRAIRYSDPWGFLHSVREIFQDEVYRFSTRNASPRIVDAGANIGLSVLYFKTIHPDATVVAYEPDADIFAMLRRNVGDMAGVELRQAAAWKEDTTLTFFREGSLAGSTEIDYLDQARPVEVRAERLRDELVRAPVDFLKLDIEGAENAVLFDIADQLDRVDHLFFEYHSSPGKPQLLGDLLNLVAGKGFRYSINGAHGPRLPFVEKLGHGFDLQLNVFCFRE